MTLAVGSSSANSERNGSKRELLNGFNLRLCWKSESRTEPSAQSVGMDHGEDQEDGNESKDKAGCARWRPCRCRSRSTGRSARGGPRSRRWRDRRGEGPQGSKGEASREKEIDRQKDPGQIDSSRDGGEAEKVTDDGRMTVSRSSRVSARPPLLSVLFGGKRSLCGTAAGGSDAGIVQSRRPVARVGRGHR